MEPGFGSEPAQQAIDTPAEAPAKRGGWPKGKPRKPVEIRSADVRSEPVRDGVRRERKRRGGQAQDKFELPENMTADFKARGMTPEWKRVSTYGATDPYYEVFMAEQGWEPVDSTRYPGFVTSKHSGPILRDGLMLMERPVELTREAKQEDLDTARGVVRAKEAQLYDAPPGTMAREQADGRPAVRVSKSVERGMAVDD